MLMQGLISAEQLHRRWQSKTAWRGNPSMPGRSFLADCRNAGLRGVALCGTAVRLDNDELIVGSEDGIDPVSWRP